MQSFNTAASNSDNLPTCSYNGLHYAGNAQVQVSTYSRFLTLAMNTSCNGVPGTGEGVTTAYATSGAITSGAATAEAMTTGAATAEAVTTGAATSEAVTTGAVTTGSPSVNLICNSGFGKIYIYIF
jgi:hypothetical protein